MRSLIVTLLLVALPISCTAPTKPVVYALGDLNHDGLVDYDDLCILELWISHNGAYRRDYDINGDGVIDAEDLLELRRMVV